MRITSLYRDTQKVWETPETEVIFGRSEDKLPIILDLSPDQRVSRMHGRIWEEGGLCWIEDLNSSRGTQLNGAEIKGRGKQQLNAGDSILAGQTTLRVESSDTNGLTSQTKYLEHGTFLLREKRHLESGLAIAKDIDATAVDPVPQDCSGDVAARRLKMVCDLPFQFATKATLGTLLPAIVDQLVEVIPNGESWALVLGDPETDTLLLRAYHYVQRTYLSETLLRRAMTERKAFIWKKSKDVDVTGSVAQSGMEIGIYAPLLWQGEALGAICAGARNEQTIFSDEDVRLLVLVSQYAAMAVATHRRQEKLRRESVAKAKLLRQFPPKVANHLLTRSGRLRLGGRRSEVSILYFDIRGLTQLAPEKQPDEVLEILNEYLSVLVPVIFAHHGTVDKSLGGGVLAVFGGPEPYSKHFENALRAAVEMQLAARKLDEDRQPGGVPRYVFGIGVHCGEVVHGFVGASDRMEFTVIGDAADLAARYASAAPEGQILISPEIYKHVSRIVEAEEASIPGKPEGALIAHQVNRIQENAQLATNAKQPEPSQ